MKPTDETPPAVYTCPQVAELTHYHPKSVARLARQGRIPGAMRFGHVYKFDGPTIRAWVASCRLSAA